MFASVFVDYLQKNNLTAYKVAKETGISQGLMNQYKNGVKTPTVDNLLKISNYLNCSVDYLLGISDNPVRASTENPQAAVFTAENGDKRKAQLIKNYELLNDEGQEDLLDYSDMLAGNPRKIKEDSNTIQLNA